MRLLMSFWGGNWSSCWLCWSSLYLNWRRLDWLSYWCWSRLDNCLWLSDWLWSWSWCFIDWFDSNFNWSFDLWFNFDSSWFLWFDLLYWGNNLCLWLDNKLFRSSNWLWCSRCRCGRWSCSSFLIFLCLFCLLLSLSFSLGLNFLHLFSSQLSLCLNTLWSL